MSDRWMRYFEFFRRDPRRDFDDEMRSHIEMRVADLVARGVPEAEALARATAEFGDAHTARASTLRIDQRVERSHGRSQWRGDIGRDARVALRSMRSSPGFAVTAILSAALGIGVTAAIVSASWSILVRPLPYRDADRLVAIYAENPERGYHGSNISWPDFIAWRDRNRTFSSIGIWTWNTQTLAGDGAEAERVYGAEVSPELFPLLGVRPVIGRSFAQEEEVAGRNFVVLLGYDFWQRRFAGDSTIVGKPILLDGRQWTVVGIMPPGFNFPDRGQLWIPFSTDPAQEKHENRGYAGAIGRMKPGVTLAQARDDIHRVDAELVREFPDANTGWRGELIPMRDDLVGDLRQPLEVFLWAVALVLTMVCANVANLMLARGATRSREMAVRTALGASRHRLVRQLLTESLIVAAVGGILGTAIAWWGVRLLRFGFPNGDPPFYVKLALDGYAIAVIATITLASGILFGIIPALRGTRVDLNSSLRDGSRGAGMGRDRSRLRDALVVGEIALAVVLTVGALLLVRSYRNIASTPLGFDQQVLSARITLPRNAGYPARADVAGFYDRLLDRLRNAPGVAGAGAAQGTPFSGWDVQAGLAVAGSAPSRRNEEIVAHYQFVTHDYFRIIGVRLVRGRLFDARDRDSTNMPVLINEKLASQAFSGADPIGKRISVGGDSFATIVGVVSDYRHYRFPQVAGPAVFYPFGALQPRQMTIVLRPTAGDPNALTPLLRAAVREIDPQVALYQVQTLEEVVTRSLWRQRLQGSVLAIFAAMALALACIGLYGVISYAVAQRTRELGVRMALGATRFDVVRLIFGQSSRLVGTGLVVGLAAAWFAVQLLTALLFGVPARDVGTFAIVPAILGVVALAAAVIPSRRATRVDPIIAMRAE